MLVKDQYPALVEQFAEQWFLPPSQSPGVPAVAEIESVVEPDGALDDLGRESGAFVDIHPRTIRHGQLSWQYQLRV